MAEMTITHSEGSKGFPSFYSFIPDYMKGMNQFFYTWKGGNLYRHNTNNNHCQFYGVDFPATITGVFNDMPLQNKIFKTINLEADDSWEAYLTTDIQTTGYIDDDWFEKKEEAWFAFVRNDGPTGANTNQSEWELRSLNGIGRSQSVGGPANDYFINFDLSINIGSIASIGDYLYFAVPPYDTPVFAGVITQINVNKVNGTNQIVIDSTTVPGTTNPIPIQDAYFLYIKNPVAESHGVLGHYCEFFLELPVGKAQQPSELFAVESEVMKSFP